MRTSHILAFIAAIILILLITNILGGFTTILIIGFVISCLGAAILKYLEGTT